MIACTVIPFVTRGTEALVGRRRITDGLRIIRVTLDAGGIPTVVAWIVTARTVRKAGRRPSIGVMTRIALQRGDKVTVASRGGLPGGI